MAVPDKRRCARLEPELVADARIVQVSQDDSRRGHTGWLKPGALYLTLRDKRRHDGTPLSIGAAAPAPNGRTLI
ncbi:MAG: hypothetical protein AAFV38_13950 [Pseudomonadota bacterium]